MTKKPLYKAPIIFLIGMSLLLLSNQYSFAHDKWKDKDWDDHWGYDDKDSKKDKKNHGKHWGHRDKNPRKHRRTCITTLQNLRFDSAIAGFPQAITTHPLDDNAAIFEATGQRWGVVTISVKEKSTKMTLRKRHKKKRGKILINHFTTGGSLNRNGRGVFNRFGYMDNIRVGATANIKKNSKPGAYHGRATLRLVYQ